MAAKKGFQFKCRPWGDKFKKCKRKKGKSKDACLRKQAFKIAQELLAEARQR